jgi:hypothetical protein
LSTDADAGATYGVTLANTATPTQIYTLVPSNTGFSGTYGTYYTYNGAAIPAGTYTVTLNVTAAANYGAAATQITLGRYDWAVYKITDPAGKPALSRIAHGEGQAGTPISYDATHIYWGVWGGTRSYYQFDTSSPPSAANPAVFTPNSGNGDDFYGAGAALVSIYGVPYVVFGSDSATVYVRSTSSFGASGGSFTLPVPAFRIRSSIALSGGKVYFTSYSPTAGNAYVWSALTADLPTASSALPGSLARVMLPVGYTTTSTPVISSNGYIYVGYSIFNSYPGAGGVVAIDASAFTSTIDVYSGDPVQASPIVYSNDADDYVCFTTNSDAGKGYCYCFDTSFPTVPATIAWSAGGTSSNPYAVQGFASDGGYLVYGDDGNYLYIMH